MVDAGVDERLLDGEVRIVQLDVLADDGDRRALLRGGEAFHELRPLLQVRSRGGELELAGDDLAEAGGFEDERHFVDRAGGLQRDDGFLLHGAEERDLLAEGVRDRVVRAGDDDVRLDAEGAELAHGVLRGLRLELVGAADVGQQGDVDGERLRGIGGAHLADRLEEDLPLDVADGAADLHDDDVRLELRTRSADASLDLVGDVRDGLDRAAEVVAPAFLADDLFVDLAGGRGVHLREVGVDEALVVAEVEVGLGAVIGDEDLAVLVRGHRAGVDVDVRVEFEDGDGEPAGLEDAAQRSGDDALPH